MQRIIPSFFIYFDNIYSHKLTAAVGFNAVRFQPSFTSHLLLAFAEQVLIERFSIVETFPEMLGQSYRLGRHSDVFLLTTDAQGLKVRIFSWAHTRHCPWGHRLPLQCPDCGWPDSWISTYIDRVYHFGCRNGACKKSYTFCQPFRSRVLLPGKKRDSCWLEIEGDSLV